jgi:tetratricopeptide (TPR) repeat protein
VKAPLERLGEVGPVIMNMKKAGQRSAAPLAVAVAVAGMAAAVPASSPESEPPATPREFFNAGTQQLRAGKLREAEASLESALASQTAPLQPPALFNLGHVRFGQGAEQLKKGPPAKPTADRGRAAAQSAEEAIRRANQALQDNNVQEIIASYLRGRGARRELRAAERAVRQAMENYGTALARWQRSDNDFKSAREMNRADTEAQQNAEAVERAIAKLVDSLRDLEQANNGMSDTDRQLAQKLKDLKGRIPEPDMPPGAAGEDEEDEQMPEGQQPNQQEGLTQDGQEIQLSPEQAAWLLQGFKLDGERRLPMGQQDTGDPKGPARRPW